jgi:uncharacterized membrane protein YcaP (DUF421 family)
MMLLMRISGKRQVGELQLSEFVTAVMISELAVTPITSKDTPVLICYIPLISVIFIEVTISMICKKSVKIRRFFDGSPLVLVSKGRLVEKNLTRTRVSIDEILTEIRLHGYKDIFDIEYVILEQNGKLSVFPKREKNAVTLEDMKITSEEYGIGHCLIVEGYVDKNSLEASGRNKEWLDKKLKEKGIKNIKNVLLFVIDDSGMEQMITREG